MDDILEAFAIESAEVLEAMETSILALERGEDGAIESLFRAAHTLKGSAGIVGLGRLERYAHAFETRLGGIRSGAATATGDAFGALLRCRDRCAAILREPDGDVPDPEDGKSLSALDASLSSAAPEPGLAAPAPSPDAHPHAEGPQRTVRVSDAKLDVLMNLASELVTVQAQLSRMAAESADRGFLGISESVRRLVSELRSTSMEMRLVRVDGLFSRYGRMVRDVSKELGKEAELVAEGGDTELDKNAVEGLVDPLMHLLRNAVGHGLETPEERAKAGKPRAGRIGLSARPDGGFVVITVSDDGRGIDWERVATVAAERGLDPAGAELEELLFEPGFSTANEVSSVSGRGVGLDVVKTAIERLGGTVSASSERGAGTAFSLRIPLTIAIIDGFLAVSGELSFIVPLANVVECFERPRVERRERLVERGGELIPYVDLRRRFTAGPPVRDGGTEAVLVVSALGGKMALSFDRLVGGYQTVIKPLGEITRYARAVAGAAVLADGTIALILDVHALAKSYKDE